MIIVYTLENCPNCVALKSTLDAKGIRYETRPMDTAESISEMRVNQCFAAEAPVVQVGDVFYEYRQCKGDAFYDALRGS